MYALSFFTYNFILWFMAETNKLNFKSVLNIGDKM